MKNRSLFALLVWMSAAAGWADGPADNIQEKVRRIPPPGVAIPVADRNGLEAGVAELQRNLDDLRRELQGKPALLDLLPDVQIYEKAVRWALAYDEFFKTNEVQAARNLLRQGTERTLALRDGRAPWLAATGLVVRGYVSRIDGSVQPYGLVVPAAFQPHSPHAWRLDFWFHGRGEVLSELAFLNDRQRSPGEFTPAQALVVHLYGRYCNGSRFAGETDFFEVWDHVRRFYRVDDERTVVRGFSLGGAACWHFATHHAWRWAAAAPGAGFSETEDFLRVFQKETLHPAWYERKLWHLYDSTDYAANLFQCPTVAYSGENDNQKQAADLMAKALAAEGLELTHVIGPKTKHSYHPEAKKEINRRLDAAVGQGRDAVPREVRLTTWTLRYPRMAWVTVDGLGEHWERARVEAAIDEPANALRADTTNVTGLTFTFDSGQFPLAAARPIRVILDGQSLAGPHPQSDRSWTAHFSRAGGTWAASAETRGGGGLRKRHGLQGPIDDAFMESFLMVRPTGAAANEQVGRWVAGELAHATNHWRQHFRGDARVKDDTEVTDADIAAHHLVLWGDPSGNKVLARIADKLPLRWDGSRVQVGTQEFPAAQHAVVLIYPNPLNPARYVVLNSGFTFREYDYLNNARQTPKLPDYAVVDVSSPVTSRGPGRIAAAGFFGEQWELKPARE